MSSLYPRQNMASARKKLRSAAYLLSLTLMAGSLTASPARAAAVGQLEQSGASLSGWMVDSSAPTAPANVEIYLDGPRGVGIQVATVETTIMRTDVNKKRGVTGYHGFSWTMPDNLKRSLHIWYVYGKSSDGSATLINNGVGVFPVITASAAAAPQTVVRYSTQACEPMDIPDHPARAFRTADGGVTLIASHRDVRAAVGGTLDTVVHGCSVVHASDRDPKFEDFRYYQWFVAPYTLDGKTMIALIHNEWYGAIVNPACNNDDIDSWISAITLAYSTDGGKTFKEPADYIVRRPITPWSNNFGCSPKNWTVYGDLGGSNIIARAGYYYKFFQYITEPNVKPWQSYQCVMRTRDLTRAGSWEIWTGNGWEADRSAPCAPLAPLQNARSVTYNVYLGMYVAIQWFGTPGFTFSVSRDLVNWSPAMTIATPGMDTSSTPYPSLLDPKDTTLNFERTGQTPFLYYTQLHNHVNGDLMRVQLRFAVQSPY